MSKFILSFSHTLFLDLHSTEFVRISSSSFVDSTIISFSRLCQNLILILCKFYHNLIFCQAYHILILFLFFSLVYQNPPLSFQYVKILLSHSSQLCQYLIPFLSLYSLLNFNLFSRSIFACIQRQQPQASLSFFQSSKLVGISAFVFLSNLSKALSSSSFFFNLLKCLFFTLINYINISSPPFFSLLDLNLSLIIFLLVFNVSICKPTHIASSFSLILSLSSLLEFHHLFVILSILLEVFFPSLQYVKIPFSLQFVQN